MLSKSDVGTYTYAPPGSPLPHAVASISGSTISTTFTYDPDGNQTSGLGRTITWTSYNAPATITQGTATVSFLHDVDHQRYKQVSTAGTTLYIAGFGVLAELAGPGTPTPRWTDYLTVGNAKVGMRVTDVASQAVSTRYFHTDHLGSIAVITDEAGTVVERLSYDAWGKRRFVNGADDPTGSIESQSTRGFTGEEQLDQVGLVHLNGRVYDPLVGRMISADPTVPDPMNAQAWNRYSYVGNDPLAFTDPTGFSWLSSFFHSVVNFFQSIFNAIPILRSIVQIAITAALNVIPGLGAVIAAAAGAAIVTGLSGGRLGDVLRAAALAAATAAAFDAVGDATKAMASTGNADGAYAFNIGSHAAVGCLSSVASGGSCQSGALAAGAGAAAAPALAKYFPDPLHNSGDLMGGTAVSGIVGGLASVAGGGKFENGAVTASFGYMFNWVLHDGKVTVDGVDIGNDAHATLEDYARQNVPGTFTEQYSDGQGTQFGGRIDIGNIDPLTNERSVLEIKPVDQLAAGQFQVLLYSLMSSITGQTYIPSSDFLFANRSMSTITLSGVFGTYTFNPAGAGVVLYNDFKPYPDVVRSPVWVGGQRALQCLNVCSP